MSEVSQVSTSATVLEDLQTSAIAASSTVLEDPVPVVGGDDQVPPASVEKKPKRKKYRKKKANSRHTPEIEDTAQSNSLPVTEICDNGAAALNPVASTETIDSNEVYSDAVACSSATDSLITGNSTPSSATITGTSTPSSAVITGTSMPSSAAITGTSMPSSAPVAGTSTPSPATSTTSTTTGSKSKGKRTQKKDVHSVKTTPRSDERDAGSTPNSKQSQSPSETNLSPPADVKELSQHKIKDDARNRPVASGSACRERCQQENPRKNLTKPSKQPHAASPRIVNGSASNFQHRGSNQHVKRNDNASGTPNTAKKKPAFGVHKITPMEKNFEDYWSSEDVQRGLKTGQLIQGALRINQKNFQESYVSHPDGKSDILINGFVDRNRGLNGDIVCVCVYPKDDWMASIEDLNEKADEFVETFSKSLSLDDAGVVSTASGTRNVVPGSPKPKSGLSGSSNATTRTPNSSQKLKNSRYMSLKDIGKDQTDGSVKVSPVVKRLFSSGIQDPSQSDGNDEQRKTEKSRFNSLAEDCLHRTGKVVYIIEKVNSRACVGRIKPITDTRHPNTAFFSPNDSRMPRIIVSLSDCPEEFKKRPEDFENTLFIARITDWSLNLPFARGCLHRSLGEAGEIEPETEGMLVEYDLDFGDFSADVLACLPDSVQLEISDEEIRKRRDLRKECIFTIDPATARDLDDALSCRLVRPGVFEVGVHIADVSHFVKPETSLDMEASRRCTSVYLVQKVIPMLPHLLCERLCSLGAGEDRLCFSVIWNMTEDGKILDEWFGKTIIRSCVKMSYEHAQGFIQEPDREWTTDELPPIDGGFGIDVIHDVVLNLNKIAVHLRKRRFDEGALRLDQVKLQFTLNKETGMPSGWYVYEQRDSNRLVEEFMLLANMATAHKIKSAFPRYAVLRRHPPPQSKMLESVVLICKELGIDIDASSAGALQQSLYKEALNDDDSKARFQVLVSLCSKPMQHARYFCCGVLEHEDEYVHYALNVPLYTHFTSPIRRYPDIMVHRLLSAALDYDDLYLKDPQVIEKQCELCNNRKTAAKRVSEMSAELFFGLFLKNCGPLEEKGMVMSVLDKAFDVLILKFGVIKRAYCDKLPLKSYNFSKIRKKPQLELIWKADSEHPVEICQELTLFTAVNCQLVPGDDCLRWNLDLKHPVDAYI